MQFPASSADPPGAVAGNPYAAQLESGWTNPFVQEPQNQFAPLQHAGAPQLLGQQHLGQPPQGSLIAPLIAPNPSQGNLIVPMIAGIPTFPHGGMQQTSAGGASSAFPTLLDQDMTDAHALTLAQTQQDSDGSLVTRVMSYVQRLSQNPGRDDEMQSLMVRLQEMANELEH